MCLQMAKVPKQLSEESVVLSTASQAAGGQHTGSGLRPSQSELKTDQRPQCGDGKPSASQKTRRMCSDLRWQRFLTPLKCKTSLKGQLSEHTCPSLGGTLCNNLIKRGQVAGKRLYERVYLIGQ